MTYHPRSTVERITIPGPLIEFGEWGIVLTGSKLVNEGTPAEQVRWSTAWAASPAPTVASDDIVPLGYFDDHELTLCLGDDLPATLMARRVTEVDGFSAYHPGSANDQPLTEQPAAVQEAYRRAIALGYAGAFVAG
ncbi:hypothetical protein L0Z31_09315 [Burkholderia vietnamiensis]|uniref:hypothetical protein n=1 Tax=Burkholderia vietnamiensis TaxID=60552 RepID=UPI0020191538|nr:hypothetical protein [Burkholderia vietnamiensis]MCO1351648.1 hypothetical protein [Burkholderia vietnamiensis]MCO1430160.1 hypothetical protein [Burkholderia vietnamiensis]UQN50937.1 hypothetical protein L0Y95_29300 [Burkholderia vietnamiensis]HDR9036948.1 hypothetical protein [Burkholderia vietnamiensis]HDR9070657.1 hypothetical protein [Burkholderia vietnamiensis]